LCQEFILQWNKQIDELERAGVKLVMVSIGSPENCQKLVDHLGIRDGYLHVDPDNTIYDALYLNRGVKETFFSLSTPQAFLERLKKPDGLKDLGEVLSKWSKGTDIMYICVLFSCFSLCKLPRSYHNAHHPTLAAVHDFSAFFIPPKQEQALLQGGSFVFDGAETLLAHYDESTAAHADLEQVKEVALKRAAKK